MTPQEMIASLKAQTRQYTPTVVDAYIPPPNKAKIKIADLPGK